jgi:predicted ribosome quality control (RQC) complex YloA/Tae2 family protein
MGDRINIKLICELIGNQSNIILINEDGRIIESVRLSDVETASRLILPGAIYEYPPTQDKINPINNDIKSICSKISLNDTEIWKAVLSVVDGFSPLICREIENTYNTIKTAECDQSSLEKAINSVLASLNGTATPTVLFKEDGAPYDFSYVNIDQYGTKFTKKNYNSCCELLDAFYTAKDTDARIKSAAHDIIKLITNLKARTEKKLALRLRELADCKDRENLRIYGELLKANLYSIENGSSFAEVPNYYDENMALIRIPLNPAFSPSKNAEKYFKDYKKSYAAEQALTKLTEADRQELIYFDSVLDSISRCTALAEISEIREELQNTGYIKKVVTKRKNTALPQFKEFTSTEGYRILVGKNNTQNDYITTKLSSKNDLWFHTKNIPGSHVIVMCGGEEVSDETVIFAATLAATNSNASNSSNVPVDYTYIKNVKKPAGAKPGMVIYTTNKTVYVTPERSIMQ